MRVLNNFDDMDMIQNSFYIICITLIVLSGCTNDDPYFVKSMTSPTANGDSQLPRLVSDSTGNLFMSWVESDPGNKDMSVLKYSRLHGDSWTSPVTIAQGDDWFVNWADFPTFTVVAAQPRSAHWLQKVPGNAYSYHVKVSVTDKGKRWSDPFSPHFDSTATEHGFVSMVPWSNRNTLAIWLDGRQSAHRGEDEYFDLSKAMTLRSAVISQTGTVTKSKLIDQTVCDCCQTTLVNTPDGALAAYRNRTEDETRDIYISRYTNDTWSEPTAIYNDGWKIGACPVNGPSLAINKSIAVVAWFTGADNQRMVKAAISTDAGQSFSDPVRIDEGNPIGRVDAAVNDEGKVFISWMERTDNDEVANLKVRALSADGVPLHSKTIAEMNSARSNGFPQMELQDSRLVFAWTDSQGEYPEINVSSLSAKFADE